ATVRTVRIQDADMPSAVAVGNPGLRTECAYGAAEHRYRVVLMTRTTAARNGGIGCPSACRTSQAIPPFGGINLGHPRVGGTGRPADNAGVGGGRLNTLQYTFPPCGVPGTPIPVSALRPLAYGLAVLGAAI